MHVRTLTHVCICQGGALPHPGPQDTSRSIRNPGAGWTPLPHRSRPCHRRSDCDGRASKPPGLRATAGPSAAHGGSCERNRGCRTEGRGRGWAALVQRWPGHRDAEVASASHSFMRPPFYISTPLLSHTPIHTCLYCICHYKSKVSEKMRNSTSRQKTCLPTWLSG